MMRMVSALCLALVFLLLFSLNVYAQEEKTEQVNKEDTGPLIDTTDMRYEKSPLNKLGRGIINVVTCWAEIPGDVAQVTKDKGALEGMTLGLVEGVCTTLLRALTGVFDTATFIIPPYNRPLMEPEYALQSMEEKCSD